MKQKHSFVFLFFLLIIGISAQAQCDPWIQKAYQQLFKRNASAQECNIKNYNNGSWNNYCELVGYIAAYNKKGDPWIFQAYCELYSRVPEASEVNISNYNNGSWNNYNELKRYIQNYQTASTKEKTEKIQASYMLAFGRKANQTEVNYWLGQPAKSVADYLNYHRQTASNDRNTRRALIKKSYQDILGRTPSESEITYWTNGTDLYFTLAKNHVQWLADNPAEYENVIKRSYQAVLGRQPDAGEISYWKGQGTLSYAVLLSCHEEWKRTNGQVAKKTSGKSNISGSGSALQFVPLSDKTASEVKNIAGINGGNVISPGGGNVISPGGGNVIAAGDNVVSPGGGNVVSPGGGN